MPTSNYRWQTTIDQSSAITALPTYQRENNAYLINFNNGVN